MKSQTLGKNILRVEVTNISNHGFWLLANDTELFLPFKEFPWFKNAGVESIMNVEEPFTNHFYWPDLDVDLDKESIENPKKFPLISKKSTSNKASQNAKIPRAVVGQSQNNEK